jgi:hypothetical protein
MIPHDTLNRSVTSARTALEPRNIARTRKNPDGKDRKRFRIGPPEVAVQLHEAREESSISFDLLLSVSIYYFSSLFTSGFRFVI